MDGRITSNEDIIDRVLDFVCGVGALTDIHWVLDFVFSGAKVRPEHYQ